MRVWNVLILAAAFLGGCGPDLNGVANRLRETNIAQAKEIGGLKEQVAERNVRVAQLQAEVEGKVKPVQTLPSERLAELFTAAKVEIRPQSDAWDFGGGTIDDGPAHLTGFRVFVRVYSEEGTIIPATGKMVVEAFELPAAPAEPVRVGTWEFTAADMKKCWYDTLGLHQFAFDCPWKKTPASKAMSFRVTFTDALTGRVLSARLDRDVKLPTKGN